MGVFSVIRSSGITGAVISAFVSKNITSVDMNLLEFWCNIDVPGQKWRKVNHFIKVFSAPAG